MRCSDFRKLEEAIGRPKAYVSEGEPLRAFQQLSNGLYFQQRETELIGALQNRARI